MRNHAGFAGAFLLGSVLAAFGQSAADVEAGSAAQEVAQAVLDENVGWEISGLSVPGSLGALSRRARTTVTVAAIDAETREIAFVTEGGRTDVFTAGPGAVRFDRLAVGDRVTVDYAESLAVYLSPAEVPESVFAAAVVRPEDGATPGGRLLAQGQVTAQIVELDRDARQVKLRLSGGELRAVSVNAGIDLAQVEVGDSVAMAFAKTLAIVVDEP